MRLFYALEPPEALVVRMAALQEAARGLGMRAAWPAPEGMHLTLAFLGERPAFELERWMRLGAEVAARHGAFALCTAGLGAFPDVCPRVAWLGLEACEALERLALDLAASAGLDTGRPFRPHLTWARLKGPLAPEPAAPEPLLFPVQGFALFRSRLGPGPARYAKLGEWALRAGPGAPGSSGSRPGCSPAPPLRSA